jgi:hypothetical protein
VEVAVVDPVNFDVRVVMELVPLDGDVGIWFFPSRVLFVGVMGF